MTDLFWLTLGLIVGALAIVAHDDPKITVLEDDLTAAEKARDDALEELDDTRAERDAYRAHLDDVIAEEEAARADAETYARDITTADRPLLRIVGGTQ